MAILTIMRLTLTEAGRRRLLHAAVFLTLIMVGFTGWGFSRLPTLSCDGHACPEAEIRLTAAVLLILIAYMFNFILAIGAAFIAAPAIAGDVESGLLLALLPRPIRRSDVVLGKWLALVILVAGYAALTCLLEFLVVDWVLDFVPPHPVEAALFLAAQSVVLLSFTLLASTRLSPMTGGVIAVVLFGLAWLGGIAEQIGLAFSNVALTDVGTIMSLLLPTDGLWRGAIYNLEPVAVLAMAGSSRASSGNPFFFVAGPPPTPYLIWAVLWVVVILRLAVVSFNQRDL
jgi:ABC-type transport system involved in multi-copper enzyme maturation permease subunit